MERSVRTISSIICILLAVVYAQGQELSPRLIIEEDGYPYEEYDVVTKDGYTLTLQRMPKPMALPIILVPGFLQSSVSFLLQGPGRSLAFLLYDEDYDVWLANPRGSKLSRGHEEYDAEEDLEYWDFSFHEKAIYDLPAIIDKILEITYSDFVYYLGNSQGATLLLALCATYPDYGYKIERAMLLAPLIGWDYRTEEQAQLLEKNYNELMYFADSFGLDEQFHHESWYGRMMRQFCIANREKAQDFCNIFQFMITGFSLNDTTMPVFPEILQAMPAGATLKEILHYMQIYISGKFQPFDYGSEKNLEVYNQTEVPEYNLDNVLCEITVFFALDDNISNKKGMEKFVESLPNVQNMYKIDNHNFQHNQFIWSPFAKEIVYDSISKKLMAMPTNVITYQTVTLSHTFTNSLVRSYMPTVRVNMNIEDKEIFFSNLERTEDGNVDASN